MKRRFDNDFCRRERAKIGRARGLEIAALGHKPPSEAGLPQSRRKKRVHSAHISVRHVF